MHGWMYIYMNVTEVLQIIVVYSLHFLHLLSDL